MSVERKIITPALVVEMFGPKGPGLCVPLFAIFTEPTDDQVKNSLAALRDDAASMPEAPGKKEVVECWQHLLRAYEAMTVFERNRLRTELIDAYGEYLAKVGA